MAAELYIGLMSGTSVDAIDAALVAIDNDQVNLVATHSQPIAPAMRADILALCRPGANEIDRLGELDRRLGLAFADAVHGLLETAAVAATDVRAIGSHGQTVRHRPPDATRPAGRAFSLQIGDPHTIAHATGITTVADFRRRDIAAGGQGAPLLPLFHRRIFADAAHAGGCAVVNIGGMANITGLWDDRPVIGFDTGPGNVLLDAWICRQRALDYDRDGAWAAAGQVLDTLLDSCLSDPYFAAPPPKSTGREQFHLDWIEAAPGGSAGAPVDVQATLLELTARSIVDALRFLPAPVEALYVCGGGAFNRRLMQRLGELAAPRRVDSTQVFGVDPQWVEAMAFAWFAAQATGRLAIDTGPVTGATRAVVLGAIHPV